MPQDKVRKIKMVETNEWEQEYSGQPQSDYTDRQPVDAIDEEALLWRQDTLVVVLAAIIAICAVGILLLLAIPLLAQSARLLGVNLPAANQAARWLSSDSKGFILAMALTMVAVVSFLALRYRARRNPLLCSGAGCPNCLEHEFIRVRRRRLDRLVAGLGIPVRRYVCRNCSWGGLRIGGPVVNGEGGSEAIAADLFLAGDVGLAQGDVVARENGSS
jgi:hypothetical protein